MQMFLNNKAVKEQVTTKTVDLTKLDNNKWYPYRIYKISNITNLRKFEILSQLDNGGSPSYGTHGSNHGAFSTMTILAAENGWGMRSGDDSVKANAGYILDANNNFISDNKKAIAVKISSNGVGIIFYLRGGLKYSVSYDSDLNSQLYIDGFQINNETYNPVTEEPSNDPSLIDLKSKLGG